MSFLKSFSKQERLLKKFYKKTGILLTTEPIEDLPKHLVNQSEKLYHLIPHRPEKTIPELEILVKDYPEIPTFKNHLYSAYMMTGQEKKGVKLLDKTIIDHPTYVFGIFNKLMNLVEKKDIEKYAHLLGNPRDVRTLEGTEAPIHISVFINYQMAAGHYEAIIGEEESALERLETLLDIDARLDQLEPLIKTIAICRLMNIANKHRESEDGAISVESVQKINFPFTKEPPQFRHSELNLFYNTSTEKISKKQISNILSLPKTTLIADLNLILKDSIRRFEYFENLDYDENTHEAIIHALYFLGALKAEESLEQVLNLLRMGEGFTDYWFADMVTTFLHPTLYALGENQLEVLKQYVLEDDLFTFDRMLISRVVAQVAIHQPNRREEVVQWFKEVINYHLENPDNQRIIDTDFLGALIDCQIDYRGVELIPQIEILYQKGWGNEFMNGPLEVVLKEINKDFHLSNKLNLPTDIHEYYSQKYLKRDVAPPPPTGKAKAILDDLENSKAEQLVMSYALKLMASSPDENTASLFSDMDAIFDDGPGYDDYEPAYTEPFKREIPKVGRNAPCPCGSGKKYKMCCLKK